MLKSHKTRRNKPNVKLDAHAQAMFTFENELRITVKKQSNIPTTNYALTNLVNQTLCLALSLAKEHGCRVADHNCKEVTDLDTLEVLALFNRSADDIFKNASKSNKKNLIRRCKRLKANYTLSRLNKVLHHLQMLHWKHNKFSIIPSKSESQLIEARTKYKSLAIQLKIAKATLTLVKAHQSSPTVVASK